MSKAQQSRLDGYQRIMAERQRQLDAEGWSADHDDQHGAAVLAQAALCYRDAAGEEAGQPAAWPWDSGWWKPKDRQRNLERAGALYQAAADAAERAGDYLVRDSLREHVWSCAILVGSALTRPATNGASG